MTNPLNDSKSPVRYVVSFRGGIGNQLFQYAYAKYLQVVENKKVYLHFAKSNDPYKRESILGEINPTIPIIKGLRGWFINQIFRIHFSINPLADRIKKVIRFLGLTYSVEMQEESQYRKYGQELNNKGLAMLIGYWQSAEMVNSLGVELLEDIKLPDLQKNYKDIAKAIDDRPQSTAMHVRSDWYQGYQGNVADKALPHTQQKMSAKYYVDAIRKIPEQGCQLFVFADDINKASIMMDNISPKISYIMVPNYGNVSDDYASLLLMAKCKHFIISNSTFGWWGAWLSWMRNQHKDAIYIMPDKWNINDKDGKIAESFKFSSQCKFLSE